jgi:hypothetical protein
MTLTPHEQLAARLRLDVALAKTVEQVEVSMQKMLGCLRVENLTGAVAAVRAALPLLEADAANFIGSEHWRSWFRNRVDTCVGIGSIDSADTDAFERATALLARLALEQGSA